MSCTITGLGPFLRPFSKSFSASYRRSSQDPSHPSSSLNHSGTHSHGVVSYQMSTLQARKPSNAANTSTTKQTTEHSRSQSAALASIKPLRAPTSIADIAGLTLRPDTDTVQRDTAVSGGGGGTPSLNGDEDAMSRLSGESRRLIITKKTELKVEMDRASDIHRRNLQA